MISPRVDEKIKNLPVIKSLMRMRDKRRFWSATAGGYYWGVFANFSAAKSAIPGSRYIGYDHQGPALLYRDLIGNLEIRDYALLFWLGKLISKGSRILDFGGHFGVKYFTFRKFLSLMPDPAWVVYDVPAVVRAGREYALNQQEHGLAFIDSTKAHVCDIFFASGSLQYLGHSVGAEIKNLGRKPSNILIGSLPVNEFGYFTLQNIGVTISPYQIFGRQDLCDDLESLGYELVDNWREIDKACYIPQHPEHSLHHYEGFYFRLKETKQ